MYKKYLTFDDVLLLPNYSDVLPSETKTRTRLTKNIEIELPIISAAMDTVTESEMAITLSVAGGIGIIHKNMSIEKQCEEVIKVKSYNGKLKWRSSIDKNNKLLASAAISVNEDSINKVSKLVDAGVDVIVIDSAHGHSKQVIDLTREIKTKFKDLDIIVGNVVTAQGVKELCEAGADAIKVGIGSGSICTTRIISGSGAPQFTAILEAVEAAKEYNIPIISDGGIKYSGDIVKALAAGAETVVIGSLLAGYDQCPGDIVEIDGVKYKSYIGMGSLAAMERGGGDRYFQSKIKKFVPEGIEAYKEYKGDVNNATYQLVGGIKSGMGYNGASNLKELRDKANFIEITSSGKIESHPHSVNKIEKAPNYDE